MTDTLPKQLASFPQPHSRWDWKLPSLMAKLPYTFQVWLVYLEIMENVPCNLIPSLSPAGKGLPH